MATINAQGQEIPETWTYGQAETPLAPHVIVPLAALPPAGEPLPSPLGVQLPPETQAESIAARLGDFTLIAIEFPKFRDGRGFTLARTLREKYGYTGDIRAVGHFIKPRVKLLEIRKRQEHVRDPSAQFLSVSDGPLNRAFRELENYVQFLLKSTP